MTWFNCTEIRVREHTAKGRPGSRPCLILLIDLALLFFVTLPVPAMAHFVSPEWAESPQLPPCPPDRFRIAENSPCDPTVTDCSPPAPCTWWRLAPAQPGGRLWESTHTHSAEMRLIPFLADHDR
jgi:hypothetical protein